MRRYNILHTICITHRIFSIKQYNELYEILNNNSKNKNYKLYPDGTGVYKTHYLQDIGFNQIVLRKIYTKPKYKRPYIQIEILFNPKKLISNNNIKITKDKDIVTIANKFNEIIKTLDTDLPDFYYWILKRIDYATYIKTQYVKEYIMLFQKADKPSKYFKELYDIKSKRRKQKKGSFYLNSKSVGINFYDKEKERKNNKEKYNVSDQDIFNSKNILRIKVQLNKSKTDYLKYKYKFETKELHNYLTLEESREQILYYYKKCIKQGDYYNLDKAKQLVDSNADLTTRTKNNLKSILDLINKCRSIYKAREKFIGTKETFNNHLKQLDKLGINPVTIPARWDIKKLDNPINEIKLKMTNKND
ncbi:hypothetical protein ACYIU4_003689 [Clostridium botulinum]